MPRSGVQSKSIRVSPVPHTSVSPVPHTSEREGFARIPDSVWADDGLKRSDVHVYRVLARVCWEGNTVSLGLRRIAETARMSVRTARECMERLVERGHVKLKDSDRGMRSVYVLTSTRFTVGSDTPKVVSQPRAAVTLNRCGRCSKMRKVDISGYCRACKFEAEIDRRAAKLA